MFSDFGRILTCDKQTDGQTGGQTQDTGPKHTPHLALVM